MARIIIRFLACFALVFNLLIYIGSLLTGINIYKTYGKQILKSLGTLIIFIIALYVTFAFLGIKQKRKEKMTNTTNNSELKEYLEQEGISHDDVINKEIEQEHEECKKYRQQNCRVEFEEPKAEMQKLVSERIDNPNYFPITVKFTLEAIKFIDMTEFNNKTYLPCELKEAKKKYVQEKPAEELYKTLKELQAHIEGKEYCPISFDTEANPFNKIDYLMKGLRTAAMKTLIP